MKVFTIVLAGCFVFICKGEHYSSFQSPFITKLFPPSPIQVQRKPQKFEAVQRQTKFEPCNHPTSPSFDDPFNRYPTGNPCPSIDAKYSSETSKTMPLPPPASSSTIPVFRKAMSAEPSEITTKQPSEITSEEPIELTTEQAIELTTEQPIETTTPPTSFNEFSPIKSRRDYSEMFASKCKEYTDMSIENTLFSSMQLIPTFTKVTTSTCDISGGLITGGIKANPREFPHMAAIAYKDNHGTLAFGCGGSLISKKFVLTAAHCELRNGIDPASMVRLGSLNLDSKRGHEYVIDAFISHERYDPVTRQNDIAVIKLEKKVDFRDPRVQVRPACLWQRDKLETDKAIATGYGATRTDGEMSRDLMKVRLDILNNDICARYFGDDDDEDYRDGSTMISNNQLCIGSYVAGMDTCQGDSGGPVQITLANHTCVSHIIGVTSFGSTVCGGENTPAVYTRVSSYIDWIGSKIYG